MLYIFVYKNEWNKSKSSTMPKHIYYDAVPAIEKDSYMNFQAEDHYEDDRYFTLVFKIRGELMRVDCVFTLDELILLQNRGTVKNITVDKRNVKIVTSFGDIIMSRTNFKLILQNFIKA